MNLLTAALDNMISGRRSPNSSARSSGKQPQTVQQVQNKKVPAELVTYRLEGEMVYVEPAKDYEVNSLSSK